MNRLIRLAGLVVLLALARTAPAHFNMLLPSTPAAKRGEEVSFVYQWGHPYEHQLFDAPEPQGLVVVAPDGSRTDLLKSLQKITLPSGDEKDGPRVTAYTFRYTPRQRGDHLFLLQTPPIWLAEEERFLADGVAVLLHVQTQNGWEQAGRQDVGLVPLTRPYGLLPGMAFQAQARHEGRPDAGRLVEIERYNARPPRELPPDEHVTRSALTDPNGVVTATLTGPGWWSLTAQRDGGRRRHQGKDYPLRQRSTLWVFVDEKAAP